MRSHDLVRISGPDALPADAPGWAVDRVATVPWVVVRTARAPSGAVAVGVRGRPRRERFGCVVDRAAVLETLQPHQLLDRTGALEPRAPTTGALAGAGEVFDHLLPGATWGPTGAVGYELATGVPTVHPASDLDLLLQPPGVLDRDAAVVLVGALSELGCRVDAQVRTPAGLVALAELATDDTPVLARTPDGPVLVPDPWA